MTVAFITAGLLTSLGRQFRYFVRPYFMPSTAAIPSAPNALPKYPYPNLRKRLYDVLGWFMVQINLNNVASAFILLRLKDCLGAWTRMFWYTHVLIVLSLAFFHFGGRRALRRGLEARGLDGKRKAKLTVDTEVDLPSLKVSPPSPPLDEQDPKDFRWVKHALDNPPYQDAGKGVGPDGGLVDEVMKGAETPRAVTSREGSPTKGFFKDE
jgi:lysophospholipid acyltransferase